MLQNRFVVGPVEPKPEEPVERVVEVKQGRNGVDVMVNGELVCVLEDADAVFDGKSGLVLCVRVDSVWDQLGIAHTEKGEIQTR